LVGARVTNTGDATATNVLANFVWDSSNPYINLSPGSPSTLTVSSLAPGASTDFYFDVTITRTPAAYTTFRQYHITATADGLGLVSTPIPRQLYVEQLISQNRNQVLSFTGPTTVFVGQTYTYTLKASTATNGYEQLVAFANFPNAIFQIVSVATTYTAPPGATNDTTYADAGGWDPNPLSPTYRSIIGPANYPGGKAGGNITSVYTVKIIGTGTAAVTNLIYDFSGSSFHYNADFGNPTLNITALNPPADLAITKTDGLTTVTAGQTLTYTLTISNLSTLTTATGVTVTDRLPANTTFVSASNGGTFNAVTGVVTWNLGSLAPGGVTSVTVTVTVDSSPPGSTVFNTASVSGQGPDLNPTNNTATDTDTVVAPDLTIAKTDGQTTVSAGQMLTYNLTVSNIGTSDATGVIVTDTLPTNTTFDSASLGGMESGGVVTWTVGTLAPGGTATVTVTVTVNPSPGPTVVNSAAAHDNENPTDITAIDIDTVGTSPLLTLTKDDGLTTVKAGAQLTYTLTVSNIGTADATGVTVTDPLPANTTFVDAPGGTLANGIVTWSIGTLAAGASQPLTLIVDVAPSLPAGLDTIVNTAMASDNQNPDVTATDTDTVNAAPDLSVTKTDGQTVVTPGQTLTYTLTISNVGKQDATGVAVNDLLPANTTFVSASDTWSESGGVVTWPTFSLAAGASVTRTVTVTVNSPVPAGVDTITNTASVHDDGSNGPDPTPANNTATDIDAVDAAPDLAVTKTDGWLVVVPGQTVTYTLTVSNLGTQGATGVSLDDTLPANTTFVGASNGGTESAGVVSWPTFTLAAGTSVTRTVTVTVGNPLPAGVDTIVNTATVGDDGSNGPDLNPANNRASDTDGIGAVPVADVATAPPADAVLIRALQAVDFTPAPVAGPLLPTVPVVTPVRAPALAPPFAPFGGGGMDGASGYDGRPRFWPWLEELTPIVTQRSGWFIEPARDPRKSADDYARFWPWLEELTPVAVQRIRLSIPKDRGLGETPDDKARFWPWLEELTPRTGRKERFWPWLEELTPKEVGWFFQSGNDRETWSRLDDLANKRSGADWAEAVDLYWQQVQPLPAEKVGDIGQSQEALPAGQAFASPAEPAILIGSMLLVGSAIGMSQETAEQGREHSQVFLLRSLTKMTRYLLVLLGLLTLAGINLGQSPSPDREKSSPTVAPIYSLPEDGAWVDYKFSSLDRRANKLEGTMRISSVGRTPAKDQMCRWIEIKIDSPLTVTRFGKMLLAEEPFKAGLPLKNQIAEAYHQEGVKGWVKSAVGDEILSYFTMGVHGDLHERKDREPIETKLGKFTCRVVSTEDNPRPGSEGAPSPEKKPGGDGRNLEYRAWLTDEVPFGWARLQIWGKLNDDLRLLFSAEASGKGTGAKSEVEHAKAKASK
jgi:uncharacterized repeat protein (TIGR01451 family)